MFSMFFEIDARDRQVLQILDRRRLFVHEVAERYVLGLEGPRDEGCETACFFLNLAHNLQVIHALLQRFGSIRSPSDVSAPKAGRNTALPFRRIVDEPALFQPAEFREKLWNGRLDFVPGSL